MFRTMALEHRLQRSDPVDQYVQLVCECHYRLAHARHVVRGERGGGRDC